jgi:hypothetical protein
VASISKKQTIREFNDKNHYKDWLFIYDPTSDRGGLLVGPWQTAPVAKIPGATPAGQLPGGQSQSSPQVPQNPPQNPGASSLNQ